MTGEPEHDAVNPPPEPDSDEPDSDELSTDELDAVAGGGSPGGGRPAGPTAPVDPDPPESGLPTNPHVIFTRRDLPDDSVPARRKKGGPSKPDSGKG